MRKWVMIIFLVPFLAKSQGYDNFYGFSAGLSFDLGTKLNRIGISAAGYYNYRFIQANSSLKFYYNFQSLGLKKKSPEIQLGGGINFGFGTKDSVRNQFVGLTENNTPFQYAAGYSYMRYWDKNQTSQSTGLFNIQIQNFRLITENDLLAGGKGWRDRFRTGALKVDYTYDVYRAGISSLFWTGDFIGCEVVKDSLYPSRFGYRKKDKSTFGDFSLGLLSVQADYIIPGIPLNQIARLNVGVDSEKVRHVLQNKLIHDQIYFPERWIKTENPHIPMLSTDGSQYLFLQGQKVKPASLYFNAGLNSGTFY